MEASEIESKHDVLLDSLKKFYRDREHLRVLTEVLCDESRISLRVLDWLVTNYSKKRLLIYFLPGPDGVPTSFNMFLSYKAQLKSFSKKFFDPFCRRERLVFRDSKGRPFETTVGQLNFFRWALTHGVVDYGARHSREIEDDMMQSIRHRYGRAAEGDARPKRKELSRAATKTATTTFVKVTVRFT